MRKAYMAGNWKMNKTLPEAVDLAEKLLKDCKGKQHKIMVAPNFTCLFAVADVLKGSNILLGAQNVSTHRDGAHTGETSVDMLKSVGVSVVIIGHSERRHVYGETDAMINTKLKLALESGLDVILAVGELLEEREAGQAELLVFKQLEQGLAGVDEKDLAAITIAYEPVWAIGTGKTATPNDADDMHKSIRSKLSKLYSDDAAESMTIQYGGSVKPENIKELMAMPNIDGALVGGASLKPELFVPIVKFDE